jgi:hypothetical protein
METLDKYINELENDLKMDRVGLEEKTLLVAGIKGKWLSKLSRHKREMSSFQELLEEAKNKVSKEIEKNSDISYTKTTLDKLALDHETVKKIRKKIEEERLLIEFCDKALTIVSSMSFDVKNVIEWCKLELT